MSFDVELQNQHGEPVYVEPHTEGGTYVMGGNRLAELNVTYNYSKHYYEHLDSEEGLRWLDGKNAGDTIERLSYAVEQLGTQQYTGPNWGISLDAIFSKDKDTKRWVQELKEYDDLNELTDERDIKIRDKAIGLGIVRDGGSYWRPTPGNAGYALNILLGWAKQNPNATWRVW